MATKSLLISKRNQNYINHTTHKRKSYHDKMIKNNFIILGIITLRGFHRYMKKRCQRATRAAGCREARCHRHQTTPPDHLKLYDFTLTTTKIIKYWNLIIKILIKTLFISHSCYLKYLQKFYKTSLEKNTYLRCCMLPFFFKLPICSSMNIL